MSDIIRECNGLVFIGDPHVSSIKPGRRMDADYSETILNKLRFISEYCNEHNYIAVFLGDMYDHAVEKSESLKIRLLRVLGGFNNIPISNVGNHDISNRVLTDADSLRYLEEAKVIKLCERTGPLEIFKVGGKTVGIGASPYGQPFPDDATPMFPNADTIIWITHHDLAFAGAYPGSKEVQEIKGCKLAINGHMHLKKPIIKAGQTTWYNPGNITRQAVDTIDHIPSFTVLKEDGSLDTVVIPHEKHVFNLTGRLVDSISPGEVKASSVKESAEDSVFVNLLEANSSMEIEKSDDGSILMEDILSKFEKDKTPDAIKNIVLSVHKKVMELNK